MEMPNSNSYSLGNFVSLAHLDFVIAIINSEKSESILKNFKTEIGPK